jgi:phage shock protein E
MITKLLLACVLVAACSKSEPAHAPPPAGAVAKDPQKARDLIASGALVLDVRTPDEFSGGHVPSATNVPVDQVSARLADVDALAHGDKGKPIVVYCAKGVRAARAKQTLEGAGYTNVTNGGGYDDLR